MPAPSEWPGFEIAAPAELIDDVEAAVSSALDEGDLLGTSREEKPVPGSDVASPEYESDGIVKVFISPQADMARCAEALQRGLEGFLSEHVAQGRIRVAPFAMPNEDWATLWRDFFQPIRISRRLIVLPAWWDEKDGLRRTGVIEEDKVGIVRIEPGRAFGSGNHATTQLSLRFLENIIHEGDRILDFGAGSGILSYAAALLGSGPIVAIEVDDECLDNYHDNATRNHLEDRIDYRVGSSELLRPDEEFDIVISNILFKHAAPHFGAITSHLKPGGHFIYSGFLSSDLEETENLIKDVGQKIIAIEHQEEWGAIHSIRPTD